MNETAETIVPCKLPMRAQAKVKAWYDFKCFGFLLNPDSSDPRDIFVHQNQVPLHHRSGRVFLVPGETVNVTFVQDAKGRLTATRIEFPPSLHHSNTPPS